MELLQPLIASSSAGLFSIVRGTPAIIIVSLWVELNLFASVGGRLFRNEFLFAWNGLGARLKLGFEGAAGGFFSVKGVGEVALVRTALTLSLVLFIFASIAFLHSIVGLDFLGSSL